LRRQAPTTVAPDSARARLIADPFGEGNTTRSMPPTRSNETGEDFDCDYRLIGKHGREVWVHDTSTPIHDGSGRPP